MCSSQMKLIKSREKLLSNYLIKLVLPQKFPGLRAYSSHAYLHDLVLFSLFGVILLLRARHTGASRISIPPIQPCATEPFTPSFFKRTKSEHLVCYTEYQFLIESSHGTIVPRNKEEIGGVRRNQEDCYTEYQFHLVPYELMDDPLVPPSSNQFRLVPRNYSSMRTL